MGMTNTNWQAYFNLWKAGAGFVAVGTMTGAVGSHALRGMQGITSDNVEAWQTASSYAATGVIKDLQWAGNDGAILAPEIRDTQVRWTCYCLWRAALFRQHLVPCAWERETEDAGASDAAGRDDDDRWIHCLAAVVVVEIVIRVHVTHAYRVNSAFNKLKLAAKRCFPPPMSTTTTHLAFFAPAASSFHPAPYNPASQSSSRPASHATRSNRSHDPLALPPPGMDPQPSDPNVLIIHPPFTDFPNSHLHPDGLTYTLMAENPEWFLDPQDFIPQPNSNLTVIPYPPHLEPPRGWCPAKKKDLKERGAEGWPEGEEPRLRCTFCRRTYAGVNAKSMWRRHVFEKHKIAMSNRRDGNADRPRGRGSGKENRHHAPVRSRDEMHDSLVSMIVAPQTAPEMTSHKSRFRTVKPNTQVPKRRRDREIQKQKDNYDHSSSSRLSLTLQKDVSITDHTEDESDHDPPARPDSCQLTPLGEISSDPPFIFNPDSLETIVTSPPLPTSLIPESPYNPNQTPAFRHSPPPLPSDQPWRFTSPSHPLSTTRDISLTMLAPLASPIKTGPLGAMLAMHSSPSSSPSMVPSDSAAFETPGHSKILFSRPINRPQFIKGPILSPLNPQRQYHENKHLHSSPLTKKPITTRHNRQSSDLSDVWLSESSLTPASPDPFSLWTSVDEAQISPVRIPKGPLEPESPVLRNGSLPTVVALGLGLLEPFTYSKEEPFNSGDTDLLLQSEGEDHHLKGKRPASLANDNQGDASPPLKRRRMSQESTDV